MLKCRYGLGICTSAGDDLDGTHPGGKITWILKRRREGTKNRALGYHSLEMQAERKDGQQTSLAVGKVTRSW